jgi:hypothetical protein
MSDEGLFSVTAGCVIVLTIIILSSLVFISVWRAENTKRMRLHRDAEAERIIYEQHRALTNLEAVLRVPFYPIHTN